MLKVVARVFDDVVARQLTGRLAVVRALLSEQLDQQSA